MKKQNTQRWLAMFMAFVMLIGVLPMTAFAEGHTHTESCYAKEGDLLCSLEEATGHTHTQDCYCAGGEHNCGQEEAIGHTHSESCYSGEINTGTASDLELKAPTCGLEVSEGHTHTDDCICPGGELICNVEESKGHSHTEDCYAQGGELICNLGEIDLYSSDGEVTTVTGFYDAVTNAGDNDIITLGADITYDTTDTQYGVLAVSKKITIDFNGYTLSSADGTYNSELSNDCIFKIETSGSLSLVDAQIKTGTYQYATGSYFGNVIGDNYGTVTIESTGSKGISANDFIYCNRGTIIVKNGIFTLDSCFVDESYGKVEIYSGNYITNSYCFDDIYGEIIIHDATVISESSIIYLSDDGTNYGSAIIHAGSYTSTDGECIYANDGTSAIIYSGTFTADDDCVYNDDDATITIYSASFTATDDYGDGCLRGDGKWIIADGYVADPTDWKETNAAEVRFYTPNVAIRFYVDEKIIAEHNGLLSDLTFPETPTHSKGYRFLFWEDDSGTIVSAKGDLRGSCELYAVFADAEHSIKTYGELQAALANKLPVIALGADITCNGTIAIDYDCVIDGVNFSLIRPVGFLGNLVEIPDNSNAKVSLQNLVVNGSNIEANEAAIYVGKSSSLEMNKCTVKNNRSAKETGRESGGIQVEDATNLSLTDCVIENNHSSYHGGGMYYDGDGAITILRCTIRNNDAICGGGLYIDNGDPKAAISITDTVISNNTCEDNGAGLNYEGGYIHLYGNTLISQNTAKKDGGGISVTGGSSDEKSCLFMHNTSAISYNKAIGEDSRGGGAFLYEGSLRMYDDSSIDHNTAAYGGGVYQELYVFRQCGGVIRDNRASKCGGGLYQGRSATITLEKGMTFDNAAGLAGDDVYRDEYAPNYFAIYQKQSDRKYGDGNSETLGTVMVKPIAGYNLSQAISVPYYGWFIDGVSDGSWDSPTITNRYQSRESSTLISAKNNNLGYLTGDNSFNKTGAKAIWYGLLCVYDANYEGGSDYQYDTQSYLQGSNATVLSNMFTRPGHRFTGWNTAKNGTGTSYAANDTILMEHNQVLYAQWEEIETGGLTVSKTVSGSGASTTKAFTFTVTLADTSISGTYGGMVFENGVAVFTLKADESKTALNLPAGTTYTVVESDNSGYTVTVNGSDQTTATGTIAADSTATEAFNNHKAGNNGDGGNTPVSSPAKVTITAQKTLDGSVATGSDYSFILKDESGNVIQTVQNNGGNITFATLTFSETGTYTYTLSEVVGTDSTINYDTTVYRIMVDVTKSGDYKATVSYEKDGMAYSRTPVFANTTKPTEDKDNTITVTAKKVWSDNNYIDRPASVSVQLYKDGTAYGKPVSLNAENNWAYVWNNLAESATWTVDEINVPDGYTKTLTHIGNIWTITNTRTVPTDNPTTPDEPNEPSTPTPPNTPGSADTPSNPNNPDTPVTPSSPDKPIDRVPQTGDNNHIELWIALACVSFLSMLAVIFGKKRFSTRK